jgi:cell wall-associated NlpC family hydrolase
VTPGGTVPGNRAKLGPDGQALAPANAPDAVKYAIWAGNQLQAMPYVYGGGHQDFVDEGYDCSGTVSYALHGGGLLDVPEDSSDLEGWGVDGPGAWITVYTNPSHAYMVIAGLRLDTSKAGDLNGQNGPRWRKRLRNNTGYDARHFDGL